MEPTDCNEIKKFIEFVIENNTLINSNAINGKLEKVYRLFETYHKGYELSFNDYESFRGFFDDFSEISGDSVELKNDEIVFIDKIKLDILYERLNGKEYKVKYEGEGFNELTDLLTRDETFFTNIIEGNSIGGTFIEGDSIGGSNMMEIGTSFNGTGGSNIGTNFNYKTLVNLLDRQPAITILSKNRAKLGLAKESFCEICTDENHSKVLSKVCLSRKDMNSSNRQIFPSLEQCYKAIENSSNLFSKQIYQCCKTKIHYLPIINNHTDVNSGDCSYLDTCHKMKACKYLHYFSLTPPFSEKKPVASAIESKKLYEQEFTIGYSQCEFTREVLPPQWINCDVRDLPFEVLGKFAAIISDPAWDIHMSLPYGTCSDNELMLLPINKLQDEGIMLLWVTGRSIEIGRKALKQWGYKISDEIIWIKLNQLNRTIVTGRTGHWLNHSKEHLLVGIKGDPIWLNKQIDINTIVSNTRQTSRKPDEVYNLVERIVGVHSRKLEIFGRDNNIRSGWFTIGNQLKGTSISEKEVLDKYNAFKLNSNSSGAKMK